MWANFSENEQEKIVSSVGRFRSIVLDWVVFFSFTITISKTLLFPRSEGYHGFPSYLFDYFQKGMVGRITLVDCFRFARFLSRILDYDKQIR